MKSVSILRRADLEVVAGYSSEMGTQPPTDDEGEWHLSLSGPADERTKLHELFRELVGLGEGDRVEDAGLGEEARRFVELIEHARLVLVARQRGGEAEQARAQAVLRGIRSSDKHRKMSADLNTIEHYFGLYKVAHADWRENYAHVLIAALGRSDPAFRALKPETVCEKWDALERAEARSGRRKGRLITVVGVAAQLAAECGAHGLESVKTANQAYKDAVTWLAQKNALGGDAP